MKKIVLISLAVIVIIGGIVITSCWFSYNNEEITLRRQCEAQIGKIEGVHDKMWKVIQQKAQVSNEYRTAFEEIYVGIMEGRYSSGENDGSLMKIVHEQNPNFDSSMYKDLMQSIEILRTEFQKNQERLIDLMREHKTLCTTYPSTWFISNKEEIEYTIISSSKTKTVMNTGMDDDVDLFKK